MSLCFLLAVLLGTVQALVEIRTVAPAIGCATLDYFSEPGFDGIARLDCVEWPYRYRNVRSERLRFPDRCKPPREKDNLEHP